MRYFAADRHHFRAALFFMLLWSDEIKLRAKIEIFLFNLVYKTALANTVLVSDNKGWNIDLEAWASDIENT